MSPVRAGPELRKVTLNLYELDCEAMERCYGYGWTEKVRQLVRLHTSMLSHQPSTIADLEEDLNG